MSPRERLGFVIPSLAGGGAERVVSLLSQRLEMTHDVDLLLHQAHVSYPYRGTIHDLGIDTGAAGGRARIAAMKQGIREVSTYKTSNAPRATMSFMFWSNLLNLFAEGPGKTILSVRTTLSIAMGGGGTLPLYRGLVRTAYPQADLIVTLSKHVADDLHDNFGIPRHKLQPIYNPIDADYVRRLSFEPLPTTLADWFARAPVIAIVGRLIADKGHRFLIRAFAEYRRQGGDARLLIVGDGTERSKIEALLTGLELSWSPDPTDEAVALTGFCDNPFQLLRHCDLLALTSVREGFGNVLLEAMACDVPVISADCRSGPREVLAPSTNRRLQTSVVEHADYGVLMPPFAVDLKDAVDQLSPTERLWAATLGDLLDSPQILRDMRDAGQRRVTDFTVRAIARQWMDVVRA